MIVVFDTNAIVSGFTHNGNESIVLGMARDGLFELYLSTEILNEATGALPRKLGWGPQRVEAAIAELLQFAIVIDPAALSDAVAGGHADNRILDCAMAAGADYLVTGDRRHLLPLGEYGGTRIMNAVEFLEALEG